MLNICNEWTNQPTNQPTNEQTKQLAGSQYLLAEEMRTMLMMLSSRYNHSVNSPAYLPNLKHLRDISRKLRETHEHKYQLWSNFCIL